jgi:uncharacterized RDD family membrane protein YckC
MGRADATLFASNRGGMMTERTTNSTPPPSAVGAVVRLVAYALDAVVVAIAIYAAALALRAILGPSIRFADTGGAPRLLVDRGRVVVDALAGFLIAGGYFAGSWVAAGATPAQRVFGARVVRASDCGRLLAGEAIARWALLGAPVGVASVILAPPPLISAVVAASLAGWYAVLFVSTAVDRSKRGLHDRLAGTLVIRVPRTAPPA